MKRASLAGFDCPIAQTLDVVGDPWTLLIVRDAAFGVRRFEDFRRSLGIPRATLSARLAALVEHGVLELEEYSERPPRHEYTLTEKGRALRPILITMLQWGNEWSSVADSPVHLVDRDTGDPVQAVLVDEHSGRPLRDIRVERRRTAATDP